MLTSSNRFSILRHRALLLKNMLLLESFSYESTTTYNGSRIILTGLVVLFLLEEGVAHLLQGQSILLVLDLHDIIIKVEYFSKSYNLLVSFSVNQTYLASYMKKDSTCQSGRRLKQFFKDSSRQRLLPDLRFTRQSFLAVACPNRATGRKKYRLDLAMSRGWRRRRVDSPVALRLRGR